MAISSHYTQTAAIERLEDVLGEEDAPTGKKEYTAHLTLPCSLPQPMSDAYSQDIQGGFGKEFLVFCPIADIEEGDLVTINEQKYRIAGLESHTGRGANSHTELRLRLF